MPENASSFDLGSFGRWGGPPSAPYSLDLTLDLATRGIIRPEVAVQQIASYAPDRVEQMWQDYKRDKGWESFLDAIKEIPFLAAAAYVVEGVVAIGRWLYENSDWIRDCWDTLIAWLEGAWDDICDVAVAAWEEVESWGETISNWFEGWFSEVGNVTEQAQAELAGENLAFGGEDINDNGIPDEYEEYQETWGDERWVLEHQAEQQAEEWGNEPGEDEAEIEGEDEAEEASADQEWDEGEYIPTDEEWENWEEEEDLSGVDWW